MQRCSLRKKLMFYQRLMVDAKTSGDTTAHDFYKNLTRQIAEEIKQKEKAACSQQAA